MTKRGELLAKLREIEAEKEAAQLRAEGRVWTKELADIEQRRRAVIDKLCALENRRGSLFRQRARGIPR